MRQIEYYLDQFEEGHRETTFFGLLELGSQAVPSLIAAYRDEADADDADDFQEWIHEALIQLKERG